MQQVGDVMAQWPLAQSMEGLGVSFLMPLVLSSAQAAQKQSVPSNAPLTVCVCL